MRGAIEPDPRCTLGPRELVRLVYRLGRDAASGVLTLARERPGHPLRDGRSGARERFRPGERPRPGLADPERSEIVVLRRGAAVLGAADPAGRALATRLACAAAAPSLAASFDGGVIAYPPGVLHQLPLAGWARSHLESQLDGALAEALVRELAGARLTLRPELAPAAIDEVDRRMLAALAAPRRLDQIWTLARTPRFRLLAFLHFLRGVGALTVERAAIHRAPVPPVDPHRPRLDPRRDAMRLLGIDDASDLDAVKRAYRRLARALHPDLHPGADDERRRTLERRFAEITAAYEALV